MKRDWILHWECGDCSRRTTTLHSGMYTFFAESDLVRKTMLADPTFYLHRCGVNMVGTNFLIGITQQAMEIA